MSSLPSAPSTLDTPARREAFQRAVQDARAALVARDAQQALRHLERAQRHLPDAQAARQASRLRALATALAPFVEAMRVGLRRFEPTEEIDLGSTVVAVIEVRPDRLAVFMEGSRRDYTLATMPARLALVVAAAGADEHAPEGQLAWGAFQAVDRQGDRAEARRLWQAAQAAGLGVEELLPLLDEPPLAASAGRGGSESR